MPHHNLWCSQQTVTGYFDNHLKDVHRLKKLVAKARESFGSSIYKRWHRLMLRVTFVSLPYFVVFPEQSLKWRIPLTIKSNHIRLVINWLDLATFAPDLVFWAGTNFSLERRLFLTCTVIRNHLLLSRPPVRKGVLGNDLCLRSICPKVLRHELLKFNIQC